MRLMTCRVKGSVRVAVLHEDHVGLLPVDAGEVTDLLSTLGAGSARLETEQVALDDLTFLPPIPQPRKIICVGMNFADHAAEAGGGSDHPSLFIRFPDSIVGHKTPILRPAISEQFDFEGELAVIIGRSAWRVPRADALDHVAGYSCFAENSVRDFQFHARQVTAGKNFLSSGAFGPCLTTADEVGDLSRLKLTTRLNGQIVQADGIEHLVHPVDELIAYISSFTRLEPGDVIATGTPAGVGALRKPPLWMRPGDVLEVDIPGVGRLENPVAAEGADLTDKDR